MKKFIIFAVLICTVAVVFAEGNSDKGGNGTTTVEKPISSFNSIRVSGIGTVNFYESQEYRAVVTVNPNNVNNVRVRTRGNVLVIDEKPWSFRIFSYTVDVYCPNLSSVHMSGSGTFEAKDGIKTSTFDLTVSGSGRINEVNIECDTFVSRISGSGNTTANIKCGTFSVRASGNGNITGNVECTDANIEITGSGNITYKGTARDANISISGSGNFNGSEFQTTNAVIRNSGSGNARIWVTDKMEANVLGSGGIRYRGNPSITNFRNSGFGRIENM